jgi:hypothetical protein
MGKRYAPEPVAGLLGWLVRLEARACFDTEASPEQDVAAVVPLPR